MIDRAKFKASLRPNIGTNWPCPACEAATLTPANFEHFQTVASHRAVDSSGSHEDVQYSFSAVLKCPRCDERVVASGVGWVDENFEYNPDGSVSVTHEDVFFPRYFHPPLRLFAVPASAPGAVKNALDESFKLFFASPAAALNNVRVAVEELLTVLKVKRFEKAGRRLKFISLHRRIELLPAKYEQQAKLLLAIKWLGNAGSHGNAGDGPAPITMDDVLDAYDLMDEALNGIFSSNAKRIATLAKRINKRKGPARKR